MFIRRLLYLLPLFFFAACDCLTVVKGRIISNESKIPISNAIIELIDKDIIVKSNDKGDFEIKYVSGFCFDPKIKITKEYYKPFEIKIQSSNHSIAYELKSESEFINYDKPFYPNPSKDSGFITGTWINNFSRNFAVCDDSLIIYLDDNNIKKEIENIQKTLRKNY